MDKRFLIAIVPAVVFVQLAGFLIVGDANTTRWLGEKTLQFQPSFLLLALALGPLFEEIVFRWALIGVVMRKFPAWIAVTVSATVFALFHWEISAYVVVVAFFGGLLLGQLFVRYQSISYPIVAHIAFNTVGCALAASAVALGFL